MLSRNSTFYVMPLHLTKTAPSPTTILYTVSNQPVRLTWAQRALWLLLHLIRVAAALWWLLVLASTLITYRAQSSSGPRGITAHVPPLGSLLPFRPFTSPSGASIYLPPLSPPTLEPLDPKTLALCVSLALSVLYLAQRRTIQTESLLILKTLGVQTTSSSSSYLFGASTRFLPTAKIRDILILEAFRGFEVRYYLGIVIEGDDGSGIAGMGPRNGNGNGTGMRDGDKGGIWVVFPVSFFLDHILSSYSVVPLLSASNHKTFAMISNIVRGAGIFQVLELKRSEQPT